jgi:uncharacterized protein
MKIKMIWVLSLILVAGCAAPKPHADQKIKVLILTGGHNFKPEPFFKMFDNNPEIAWTTDKDINAAEPYDREDLFTYNVVLLYDSPTKITDAQRAHFLALFDHGIGVIVLHHAYLSYPLWPEFERITGGRYIYQKEQMTNGIQSSTYKGDVDIPITIVAKDSPITKGLSDFTLHDERYFNMHMQTNITPLLKSGDELIAWHRQEINSRVVGIIVGHGCYEDPNFDKLLAQSIRWAAKR